MEKRVIMLAIRIPKEFEDRLEALAKRTGRTKSYYARAAIMEHLDDLEDHFTALQRIEENLPSIPIDEVERRLGLAD